MSKRFAVTIMLLVAMTAFAGCAGQKQPPKGQNETPPGQVDKTPGQDQNQGQDQPGGKPPAGKETAAVYFGDSQAQHLIAEPHHVTKGDTAAMATELVEAIIAGPQEPHLHRTLPASVKLLESVTVEDGVATVNLSEEVLEVNGAAGEAMALGSLTFTLTDLKGIEKVRLLVEGQEGEALEHVVLEEPLVRSLRIYPPLPDPERAKYLQEQVDKGIDTWRKDAAKVVKWEGRMFGFTVSDLAGAQVTESGDTAEAKVTAGGKTYTIGLERYRPSDGIWTIKSISEPQ